MDQDNNTEMNKLLLRIEDIEKLLKIEPLTRNGANRSVVYEIDKRLYTIEEKQAKTKFTLAYLFGKLGIDFNSLF